MVKNLIKILSQILKLVKILLNLFAVVAIFSNIYVLSLESVKIEIYLLKANGNLALIIAASIILITLLTICSIVKNRILSVIGKSFSISTAIFLYKTCFGSYDEDGLILRNKFFGIYHNFSLEEKLSWIPRIETQLNVSIKDLSLKDVSYFNTYKEFQNAVITHLEEIKQLNELKNQQKNNVTYIQIVGDWIYNHQGLCIGVVTAAAFAGIAYYLYTQGYFSPEDDFPPYDPSQYGPDIPEADYATSKRLGFGYPDPFPDITEASPEELSDSLEAGRDLTPGELLALLRKSPEPRGDSEDSWLLTPNLPEDDNVILTQEVMGEGPGKFVTIETEPMVFTHDELWLTQITGDVDFLNRILVNRCKNNATEYQYINFLEEITLGIFGEKWESLLDEALLERIANWAFHKADPRYENYLSFRHIDGWDSRLRALGEYCEKEIIRKFYPPQN